jgi:protease I
MADNLADTRVVFLATDGVEQIELTEPRRALEEAGAKTALVAPEGREIQGFDHLDKADRWRVDAILDEVDPDDFDALVLPGGVANPDRLRTDERAVGFVRSFFEAGKPVGVICHGPWTIVEADLVRGRTLTSYPSLRTDIENAGGTWVDEEVCVDNGLVSSRGPDDLPAFCGKLVEEIGEGRHEGQARRGAEPDPSGRS